MTAGVGSFAFGSGPHVDALFNVASAVALSEALVRVDFTVALEASHAENFNPLNFTIAGLTVIEVIPGDGTSVTLHTSVQTQVPYVVVVNSTPGLIQAITGDILDPSHASAAFAGLEAVETFPATPQVRIAIDRFSGRVAGGLLGSPTGQVFFSPAFGASVANSVIEVESISVCTRAFDVYVLPEVVDPGPRLFTFPAPAGGSDMLGADGGLLWSGAWRLGQAVLRLSDLREDAVAPPVDGPAEGLLAEPIDITKASFLNDGRWRIFPGSGASLGVFETAANLTPIGAGPSIGPFSIA